MIFKTPVSSFSLSRGIQQTKDTTAQSVENFLKQQLKTQETMSRLNISQTLLAIHVTNVILYFHQSVASQCTNQESIKNRQNKNNLYSCIAICNFKPKKQELNLHDIVKISPSSRLTMAGLS